MNKKSYEWILVLFIFVCMLLSKSTVYAYETVNKKNVEISFFKTSTCIECYKTNKYLILLKNELEHYNIALDIKVYDVALLENKSKLKRMGIECNIPFNKLMIFPAIFINNNYYIGYDDISKNLKNNILKNNESCKRNESNSKLPFNCLSKFTCIAIFVAGLIDGINPCAIAMLLFFITYLSYLNNKNKIVLVAISYITGTFVSYFLLGVGIIKIILSFQHIKLLFVLLYSITIVFSIYLCFISIKDSFKAKKMEVNKIKTQLSSNKKHVIQDYIRNKSKAKYLFLTTFLTGFVVSLLEFSCTGQIYLPVITYLISIKSNLIKNIMLLLLYNFAFIIPLILIVISFYFGKQILSISNFLVEKLFLLKLLGAVMFFIISLIMIKQLIVLI